MNAVIDGLMTELEQLLEEKVAEDLRDLLGEYKQLEGAASDRLKQFEEEFGIALPEDFRSFYSKKDGSGYAFHVLYPGNEGDGEYTPFYLMSLDEMREIKSYFCERDERLDAYYGPEEVQRLDPEIKPYLFHKAWYPFATMAGGSLYLMLDFDPAEPGTSGQIIMYVHDPDFVYYIAPSFTELLQASNRNLRTDIEEVDY
ncbi:MULTISPECIES: SMI1/KNR4 family protein [Paenibacillus]|uniref:SMI1/KNR4 family protein n=1 Tax=Paenibacillus TaxID=44249 RepID=UPI001788237E|nr:MULTISPECIES: SMI1/KNR4 family protein [Paenibacillus]QOT08995.1 SMI1/KNR4 family protein [Paenibacillus sp. JNUCC-32]WFB59051.1 SMI1/KNR4 family protein [Paenibacillus sp. BR1-192]GIP05772.1 SMI1/KNR4 family protein [Paenibacillus lautus]